MQQLTEKDRNELEVFLSQIGHKGPYHDNRLKIHLDTKTAPVYIFNTYTVDSSMPMNQLIENNDMFFSIGMYLRVQKFRKITGENNKVVRIPLTAQPLTWADPSVFEGQTPITIGNQQVTLNEAYCVERLLANSFLAIGKTDNLVFEKLDTAIFYAPALNNENAQLYDGSHDGFYRFTKPFSFSGKNNREITLTAQEQFMEAVTGKFTKSGEASPNINTIQIMLVGYNVPGAGEVFEKYRKSIK
jgi:hypothetical protein